MTTTTTLPTVPAEDRRPRLVAAFHRVYGPLFHAGTWKETAALLLALPTGIIWFTIATTGLAVSASLLITLVGLPLLILVLAFGRLVGTVERAGARTLHDTELPAFPPLTNGPTLWATVRRRLSDGPSWKGIAYALMSLPIGIVAFTSAVVVWAVTAGLVAFPVYQLWMSDTDDVPDALSSFVEGWGRVGSVAAVGVIGLALLALAPRIIHGLARIQCGIVRRLLAA
jgi:hypothetical protein